MASEARSKTSFGSSVASIRPEFVGIVEDGLWFWPLPCLKAQTWPLLVFLSADEPCSPGAFFRGFRLEF